MPLVKLTTRAKLPGQGESREYTHAGRTICIANVDGNYAALDNVCAHHGGPLGQGVVLRGRVVCPWHGWAFNPHTGVPDENPSLCISVYLLQIEGDDVWIDL